MDIEQLINRHKDSVYRQMVRVCGNRDDAEDALANAIFAALKASEQLRDPDSFRQWLARIGTRSCARMRVRHRLVQNSSITELESHGIEISDKDPGPELQAEMDALKDCVSGAVQALPDIYRDVYLRREIFGESAEEVAAAMKLTVPALKSRLYRAREIMRDSLDHGFGCRDLFETPS